MDASIKYLPSVSLHPKITVSVVAGRMCCQERVCVRTTRPLLELHTAEEGTLELYLVFGRTKPFGF